MKKIFATGVVVALLACLAMAQTRGSAQTQGSASSSVSGQKRGAQARGEATGAGALDATQAAGQQEGAKGRKTQAGAASSGNAQANANAGNTSASADIATGTTIDAVLTKPVDAKKAKQGDEVVAKAASDVKSDGKVVIAKGSKLLGHVTEAKARGKGEEQSALGIAFDKAVLKGGQELALNTVIQAVAAPQQAAIADEAAASTEAGAYGNAAPAAGATGGGAVGGVARAAGQTVGAGRNVAGSA